MPEVFGRKYELTVVSTPPKASVHVLTTPPVFDTSTVTLAAKSAAISQLDFAGYTDYLTIPDNVTTIKEPIQMTASIKYTGGSQTATGGRSVIKLYNLDDETKSLFKQEAAITLRAGYEQDAELPLVFVGQVSIANTRITSNGMETTITCIDGGNLLKSTTYKKSFAKGHTYNFVLLQLIKTFGENGVPLGKFTSKINTTRDTDRSQKALQKPLYLNAKLGTALTQVCESIDYVWLIVLGKLYVQPRELERYKEVLNLDADQVIGTIEITDNGKPAQANAESKSKPGIAFSTYCNGNITPAVTVVNNIKDHPSVGDYKVLDVTHKLNWHDGPWQTTVKTQGA